MSLTNRLHIKSCCPFHCPSTHSMFTNRITRYSVMTSEPGLKVYFSVRRKKSPSFGTASGLPYIRKRPETRRPGGMG